MNSNGYEKPSESPPDALCPFCGFPANTESDHAVVEFRAGWTLQDTMCRVWYRDCYDMFLGQGEES